MSPGLRLTRDIFREAFELYRSTRFGLAWDMALGSAVNTIERRYPDTPQRKRALCDFCDHVCEEEAINGDASKAAVVRLSFVRKGYTSLGTSG